MIPRGTTFEFEYLDEFKMDIKNILGNESAAHMGLIHEEKRRPKISYYCTFKQEISLICIQLFLFLASAYVDKI